MKNKTAALFSLSLISSLVLMGCNSSSSVSNGSSDQTLSTSQGSSSVNSKPDKEESLKVMNISNPKVYAPSLISDTEEYNALADSSLSLITESSYVFDSKLKEAETEKPDVLIINGSLTLLGDDISHNYVAEKLLSLKNTLRTDNPDFTILLSPGANDIDSKITHSYSTKAVNPVSRDEFHTIYNSVCYSDATLVYRSLDSTDTDLSGSLAYSVNLGENFTFLVIDDANYNLPEDTKVSSLEGTIGVKQLNWIKNRASESRKKGNAVIAVSNHSLVPHFKDEEKIKYSLVDDYNDLQKALALNGVAAVYTATSNANDISSYSYDNSYYLIDISTSSSVSYPASTRTVDFTHTYSYKNKKENFSLQSKTNSTTDITYKKANGETASISDLTAYTKTKTIDTDKLNKTCKEYPYEILHSSYPNYNDKDFLKNTLADKGFTADSINTALKTYVGTPEEPLYFNSGSIKKIKAYSTEDYSKDQSGEKISYNMVIDYGIHDNSTKDYRIVLSNSIFNKIFQTTTIPVVSTDVVLYVTDAVLINQINDIITQVDTNLIKSDTNWTTLCDAVIIAFGNYKVDSAHTVSDLINELRFIYSAGSETQPSWIKGVRDNFSQGKDSALLDGLISIFSENSTVILNSLFGYLDFSTLINGATSPNFITWGIAKKILLDKACPLSKMFSSSSFSSVSKSMINAYFDDDRQDKIGSDIASYIDEFSTDSDIPDDNNPSLGFDYPTPREPK